jgi:hypothetical protein
MNESRTMKQKPSQIREIINRLNIGIMSTSKEILEMTRDIEKMRKELQSPDRYNMPGLPELNIPARECMDMLQEHVIEECEEEVENLKAILKTAMDSRKELEEKLEKAMAEAKAAKSKVLDI